jgi:dienelactone hydrolase
VGKEELFGTNATPVALGPALVRRGYVVLAIDACCFGERNGRGPGGASERGSAGELTASKFNLWAGRSLWGSIVRDDRMALDYLCSRPEVDAARVGVTGISMGATRTWWLMALDDRPAAGVAVCCLTRYRDLVAEEGIKHHGIYYYVPGLMARFDMEAVVALAAPRALLFQSGELDGGSPLSGIRTIEAKARAAWELQGKGAEFQSLLYPGVGHVYLPAMWRQTLQWFDDRLKPGGTSGSEAQ